MKWGFPKFSIFDFRLSILNRQSAIGNRRSRLAVAIIVFGLILPAYSQTQDVVLLLEQTPIKGGEITPAAGVHHFKPGTEVLLTAVPKPGYKFVHWLGEVSDAMASSTVAYLDKPKVIIAVFEQAEHGVSAEGENLSAGGGGAPGGLFPTALDFSRPGGFSGGGSGKAKPQKLVYFAKDVKPKAKVPEVPEPATGLLLVMGSLFAFRRRGHKRGIDCIK